MAEARTLADLSKSDLAGKAAPAAAQGTGERKLDKFGRAYATGKRKDAVARVWLKPGTGKFIVNGKESTTYFAAPFCACCCSSPSW